MLVYHHIGNRLPGCNWALTVSPQRFEAHLRWLSKNGYRGIHPSDWMQWRAGEGELPTKPVMITFDDGYADSSTYAFPLLCRYGFPATQFVVTDYVGGVNEWDLARFPTPRRLMSAEQIRRWQEPGSSSALIPARTPICVRLLTMC